MTSSPKPETVVAEIHRIRREISDRFAGNLAAIAEDAARRQAASGRPVWQPAAERAEPSPRPEAMRPGDA